ncbi:unnamed protein product [Acanthoscelides obtectus]|uniref:DDE Tnp4 domain-containing protein n=1 Tax=Acanthoscelides obtectus TaxID=200917 RepID=A0A9P0K1H5_ACAOB|nr:unnamed protein product [Acanthoscelides obtectus]CAK1631600.1 Protein ALP1-like [Acanthoscelides obtectus]
MFSNTSERNILISSPNVAVHILYVAWLAVLQPLYRLNATAVPRYKRYLATGIQFRQLAFSFRISKSAISTIVPQVCKAIWTQLVRKHMPEPSEDSFKNIAQCFWDRWQFPNCIGCIDGKHIRIKKPKQSGSMYYNYKSFFSIGLLAVTDANYKFVMINVGSYAKDNDAGVFEECPFRRAIEQGRLKIPKEQVSGSNIIAPYVLLGDAAFPLKKCLLRPFPEKSTSAHPEAIKLDLLSCWDLKQPNRSNAAVRMHCVVKCGLSDFFAANIWDDKESFQSPTQSTQEAKRSMLTPLRIGAGSLLLLKALLSGAVSQM